MKGRGGYRERMDRIGTKIGGDANHVGRRKANDLKTEE